MSDSEPPSKKAKVAKALPICPYGAKCYRKNPKHIKDFTHLPNLKDDKQSTKDQKPQTVSIAIDTSKLPTCPFGATCYRKNLIHFAEYSHPLSSGGPSTIPDDSGSDTDIIDSDSEDTKKKVPSVLFYSSKIPYINLLYAPVNFMYSGSQLDGTTSTQWDTFQKHI